MSRAPSLSQGVRAIVRTAELRAVHHLDGARGCDRAGETPPAGRRPERCSGRPPPRSRGKARAGRAASCRRRRRDRGQAEARGACHAHQRAGHAVFGGLLGQRSGHFRREGHDGEWAADAPDFGKGLAPPPPPASAIPRTGRSGYLRRTSRAPVSPKEAKHDPVDRSVTGGDPPAGRRGWPPRHRLRSRSGPGRKPPRPS